MSIVNHGTFAIYQPVVPALPAEPVAPTPPAMPAPLAPDATPEDQAAHAAAAAAYQFDMAVYEAAMSQHATALADWRLACFPIHRLETLIAHKAIFARRADGADWYDLTRDMPDGLHYALVIGGTVVSVADDAQMFGIQDGMTLLETTDAAVAIGWTWDGATLAPPPGPTLADVRSKKIASAWAEQEKRLAAYIIQAPISGVATPFGCDPVSRENVLGINALIDKERGGLLPAGTIPNPRGFTPKGATSPVQVTHAEFALIGAYMAGAKDQHYVAYAVHKAAISALGTAEVINSYDITTGWPV